MFVFYRVDSDRSGHISANELQQALSNGVYAILLNWRRFRSVLLNARFIPNRTNV